jgi:dolichol-phosphate mannosyltransferase
MANGSDNIHDGPPPARPNITVVVPTYNEAENLPELAARLFSLDIGDLQLLVVDDGSPDGTADIARGLSNQHPGHVSVLERSGKLGLGTAYVEGFAQALLNGPDYVFQMDADLSHPVEELPGMLAELAEADVVVGSRYARHTGKAGTEAGAEKGWGIHRVLISALGNLSIRLVAGLRVRDATSGFKGFRAEALRGLDMSRFRCKGFGFQAEVAFACQSQGYRVLEHPFMFSNRLYGESKMNLGIVVEAIWRLVLLRIKTTMPSA